jgi:hypothetical protein
MQHNMTPITNPSFDSIYQKMLDLGASNPNVIKHYALAGDPSNPLMKIAATAALDKISNQRPQTPQAPTSTVAQQIVQQAGGLPALQQPMMPQAPQMAPQMQAAPAPQMAPEMAMPEEGMAAGGLAELSIPDYMFNEQNYADGGIVDFDEGGEVPRYSGEYDPSLIEDPVMGYRKMMERRRAAKTGNKYPYGEKAESEKEIRESTKTPYDEAINYYESGLKNLDPNARRSPYLSSLGTLRGRKDAWLSGQVDPITGEMPVGSKANMYGTGESPVANRTANDPNAVNLPPPPAGIPAGFNWQGAAPTALNKADFMPNEESMADIEQRQADAYEKAGISTDPYASGIAKLKPKREQLEKDKSGLLSDFMINTGLGMAANARPQRGEASPTLFGAFAQGATPAFEKYGLSTDKLRDRADKLDDKEETLSLAKNQYLQNRTDKNLARYETAQDNVNKAKQSFASESARLEESGKEREQRGNIAQMSDKTSRDVAVYHAKVQSAIAQMDPAEVRTVKAYAASKNIPYHEAVAEYYGLKSKKSEAQLQKEFAALGGATEVGMDFQAWKDSQGYSGAGGDGGGMSIPKGTTVSKIN